MAVRAYFIIELESTQKPLCNLCFASVETSAMSVQSAKAGPYCIASSLLCHSCWNLMRLDAAYSVIINLNYFSAFLFSY